MKLYIGNYQWITNQGPAHWGFPAGLVAGMDMRPLAEQAMQGGQGGLGIFAGDINDSAYDMIGRGDEAVTKQAKAAIAKRFKVAPEGDTLADCLHSLMMAGDPRGELAHKPLLPTRGFTEIHLGGKLKSNPFAWGDAGTSAIRDVLQADFRKQFEADQNHAKKVLGFLEEQYKFKGTEWREFVPQDLRGEVDGPRKPETTISDNFNRADGALGTASGGFTYTSILGSGYVIASNLASHTGTGEHIVRADSDLSSADHYAQATAVAIGTLNDPSSGTIFRKDSTSTETFYLALHNRSPNQRRLFKKVSGSYTQLGTDSTDSYAANQVIKGEANGSTIKCYVNGVQRLSVSDSSVTGNLRCGFYGNPNRAGGDTVTLDDWSASDLSGGAGIVYTQLEKATRGMMRGMWTGYGG